MNDFKIIKEESAQNPGTYFWTWEFWYDGYKTTDYCEHDSEQEALYAAIGHIFTSLRSHNL